MDDIKKALIIKPSSLGDVIHGLPFLYALKKRFPACEVHWVIAKGLHGLLEGHPLISRLWIIDKDNWKKIHRMRETAGELGELFRKLRREKYDAVIDLQGLLRSGVIAMATGSKVRIGFKEAREGSGLFYTHKVAGGKGVHAVDRNLMVASFLGCDISEVKFPLSINDVELPFARYAVLVPGARWETKRWPPERFGELASLLPMESVVVGGKGDEDIASRVVANSKGKAVSLVGKTGLKELAGVIKGAAFVVSNDSGPMHIAAALGVPVFAIFGPTSPALTGPYGNAHLIIKADVECAPCFKRKCGHVRCLESITVKEVYGAIKDRFAV